MAQTNTVLGNNIKVLRTEARLTVEELSEKTNISIERINELESGNDHPLIRELDALCPVLRISEEDFLERDILSERSDARSRMNKEHAKGSFSWYYGDKKVVLFYVIGLVAVIIGGIASMLYYMYINQLDLIQTPEYQEAGLSLLDQLALYVGYIAYFPPGGSLATAVMIVIEIYKRTSLKFTWWHVVILFSASSIIVAIGAALSIPYIFYCLYQIIIKRGRARIK